MNSFFSVYKKQQPALKRIRLLMWTINTQLPIRVQKDYTPNTSARYASEENRQISYIKSANYELSKTVNNKSHQEL